MRDQALVRLKRHGTTVNTIASVCSGSRYYRVDHHQLKVNSGRADEERVQMKRDPLTKVNSKRSGENKMQVPRAFLLLV